MRLDYFIKTTDHMRCLSEVCGKIDGVLIFQRFSVDSTPAALTIVSGAAEELSRIYLEGGYRIILFSGSYGPESSTDWDFFRRTSRDLIVIEGGRQNESVIEMSRMRTFARDTNMQKAGKALKTEIEKTCTRRGLLSNHGKNYASMRADPALSNFDLIEKLHSDTTGTRYLVS